jgi:competence protein ComEA
VDGARGKGEPWSDPGLPGRTAAAASSPGRPRLNRTGALALLVVAAAAVGASRARRWPDATAALDCPAEALGWMDAGASPVAVCLGGGALPPDVARGVGRMLDLNRVPEDALARLPGVGGAAAHQLVVARKRAGFRTWEDVDAVPGVGPARLAVLQRYTVLEP